MQFSVGYIQLTGSIWFRQDTHLDQTRSDPSRPDPSRPDPSRPDPSRPDPSRPDRIPFQVKLTEAEFHALRHWLTADVANVSTLFQLPAPLRHLRRIGPQSANSHVLELELSHEQLPSWWNWDVVFPLTIQLTIPPPEFAYLTNIMSREHWSAELMW